MGSYSEELIEKSLARLFGVNSPGRGWSGGASRTRGV